MFGKGLVKGLGVTLKRHAGKKITRQYPEEKPPLPPRFRGKLEYVGSTCIACGICVQVCPNRVLALESAKDAAGKKRPVMFSIDLQYCLFCNLCVEACPSRVLQFTDHFELACFDRQQSKKVYRMELPEVPEKAVKIQTEGAAETAGSADETAALLAKKQDTMKKLAAQVTQLKKEAQDASLSDEERAARKEKADKIGATVAKLAKEIKELKESGGGSGV